MASAGQLDKRFFWERREGYRKDVFHIYDRQRGAGCFGENFVAKARDGATAEMLCELLNIGDAAKRRWGARGQMSAAARPVGRPLWPEGAPV